MFGIILPVPVGMGVPPAAHDLRASSTVVTKGRRDRGAEICENPAFAIICASSEGDLVRPEHMASV